MSGRSEYPEMTMTLVGPVDGYPVDKTHRRTGRGGEGAAAPPNFGQLRVFGQREKIWVKSVFKDVAMLKT